MKIPIEDQPKNRNFKEFKAIGQRRLLATEPRQQQLYIDSRNLWKASSPNQQKQYEAIQSSGLMNQDRKLTFFKFNYRHSEQKNLTYNQVYGNLFQTSKNFEKNKYKPKNHKDDESTRKFKLKNNYFLPLAKEIKKKFKEGSLRGDKIYQPAEYSLKQEPCPIKSKRTISRMSSYRSKLDQSSSLLQSCKSRANLIVPLGDHTLETPRKSVCHEEQEWFAKYLESNEKKQSEVFNPRCPTVPGTMGVCDLWDQKHLKENLGFLPCTRDRPKLLKLYSKNMKKRLTIKNMKR